MIYVIPANGQSVPDPDRGDILPGGGRLVSDNQYWQRRISDGSVTTNPAAVPPAPPIATREIVIAQSLEDLGSAVQFGIGVAQVANSLHVSDGISYKNPIICLANSGVKVNLTGTTTQTLMGQAAIPDGCMGPNSTLRIEPKWTHENDANNKTMYIGIGVAAPAAIATGSIYNVTRGTGYAGSAPLIELVNRGVTNSQLRKYSDLSVYSPGNSATAEQTSAIDFSVNGLSLFLFGTLAVTSNNLALQGYTVTLFNGYR